jgi:hypothetical protein
VQTVAAFAWLTEIRIDPRVQPAFSLVRPDLDIIDGMKKKRLLLIIGGMIAVVGLTLGVLAMLPPKPGVTKENFDRIEVGMTKAEVKKIFGGPPIGQVKGVAGIITAREGLNVKIWESKDGEDWAIIAFDDNDCMMRSRWDGLLDDRSFIQKVLDRLPWREEPPRERLWE